jgi:peroxin-1
VLDNLDLILGPESELGGASSNAAILAEHFTKLFSGSALPKGTLVLATATGSAGLHPLLTSKHIFGESMKIPPPRQETRREILEAIVVSQQEDSPRPHSDEDEALDYVTLAQLTEGYSASDLNDFVTSALQQSMIRGAKEGNMDVSVCCMCPPKLTPGASPHGRLRRCAGGVHADQPARHLLAKV